MGATASAILSPWSIHGLKPADWSRDLGCPTSAASRRVPPTTAEGHIGNLNSYAGVTSTGRSANPLTPRARILVATDLKLNLEICLLQSSAPTPATSDQSSRIAANITFVKA